MKVWRIWFVSNLGGRINVCQRSYFVGRFAEFLGNWVPTKPVVFPKEELSSGEGKQILKGWFHKG